MKKLCLNWSFVPFLIIIGIQCMIGCESKKNKLYEDDANKKFAVPEGGAQEKAAEIILSNGLKYTIIVKSIDLPIQFVETERHYKSRILSIATIDGLFFILLDESKSFYQLKHVLFAYDEQKNIVRKVDLGKNFTNDHTLHLEEKEEKIFLRSDRNRNSYMIDIESLKLYKSDVPEKPFYQDLDYIVVSKDLGEWGGTMFFEHRETGAVHEVGVDSPIIINKLDNAYIVSSTLRHEMSRSSIIKIVDPRNLHLDDSDNNFTNFMGSSHREGSEQLFSGNIEIGTSFIRDNKLYYLYKEDDYTRIGVLEKKDLDKKGLYSPYSLIPLHHFTSNINANLAQVINNDEHLLINQSTHESMGGMILIKDNNILFYYFK
jgi:hypothetical protein